MNDGMYIGNVSCADDLLDEQVRTQGIELLPYNSEAGTVGSSTAAAPTTERTATIEDSSTEDPK